MKNLLPFSALEKVEDRDRKISMLYEIILCNFEAYDFEIIKKFKFNDLPLGVVIEKNNVFEFNLIIERNSLFARVSFKVDSLWLITINLNKFDPFFKEWDIKYSTYKISIDEMAKKIENINLLIQ